MVSTAPPQPKKTFKSNITTRQLVEIWSSLPNDSTESNLGHALVSKIFGHLGYGHDRVKISPNIATGAALMPDYLIYNDLRGCLKSQLVKKLTRYRLQIDNE